MSNPTQQLSHHFTRSSSRWVPEKLGISTEQLEYEQSRLGQLHSDNPTLEEAGEEKSPTPRHAIRREKGGSPLSISTSRFFLMSPHHGTTVTLAAGQSFWVRPTEVPASLAREDRAILMVEASSDLGYIQASQEGPFELYLLRQTGLVAQIGAPSSYAVCGVQWVVDLDRFPFFCSPGGSDRNTEYPIADFYKPLEYPWSEVQYEADQALRQYIEGSHADH